ncbi:MAG: hypothetical protein R3C43_15025 [Chloroflexota bacterium]
MGGFERFAVLHDPDVGVGLGAAGEFGQQVLLANALDGRAVDVVIPRRDGLGIIDWSLPVEAQIVLVHVDVLQYLLVLAGQADDDLGVGPQLVETGTLQKGSVLLVTNHRVDPRFVAQGADDAADDALAVDLGHACRRRLAGVIVVESALGGLTHQPLVFADAQVEIGGGQLSELTQQALGLDSFNERLVDAVVPGEDGIFIAHIGLALGAQIVAMGIDVFVEPRVFGGVAQAEVTVGAQVVEPRLLQEVAVGFLHQDAVDVHVDCQAERHVDLGDVGVDVDLVAVAGDGNAMVAVLDEVDVADLVEFDRRQGHVAVAGLADVDPAVGRLPLGGQEGAVEVAVAADTADDAFQGHGLQADVALAAIGQGVAHLVERQQFIAASRQARHHLAPHGA